MKMKFLLFALIFLLYSATSLYLFRLINKAQIDPYMDEIFHVPQAQKYCKGNFSHWDPMITTLPGLYLTSVGMFKPLSVIRGVALSDLCSTWWLRFTNVLFSLGNLYLIYAIQKKLHNPLTDPNHVKLCMTSLALATLPVLYFFTFLYYTDSGSTFFVLIMYLFSLHDNHMTSALMGTLAIGFRQTNVVWVIFVAGLCVRKYLSDWVREQAKKDDEKLDEMTDLGILYFTVNFVITSVLNGQKRLKTFIFDVLLDVWPYIVVGLCFVVFVVLNKGIVVGDRTNHTVSFNIPQLFYFLAMTNCFAVFHLTSPYRVIQFIKFCWKNKLFVLAFHVLSFLAVYYFTYEHKYLLADNRHYTFYIWSKIFRRHRLVKYGLIPGYLYCLWSIYSVLKHRDVFWKMIFSLCVIAIAVPQQLLEFRYFILPYIILRINMAYGSNIGTLHEILLYVLVNAFTIYMFIEKPFQWPHESGIQRFIW